MAKLTEKQERVLRYLDRADRMVSMSMLREVFPRVLQTVYALAERRLITTVDDEEFGMTDEVGINDAGRAAIAPPVSVATDAAPDAAQTAAADAVCPFCDNSPCQCAAIQAENATINLEYARGLQDEIARLTKERNDAIVDLEDATRERDAAQAEADALRTETREVEDLLMQNGHHTPTVRLADQVNAVYRQLSAESERAATADALRKLVGEIQEVAEDALGDWIAVQSDYAPEGMGDWYTVRDLISEFVDPDAALVAARQRADWTLTPQQRAYMDQRKPFIENAYAANDMDFMRDLAASDEYKTLFGGMSWDEAYDRYEDAAPMIAALHRRDNGNRTSADNVLAMFGDDEEGTIA